MNYLKMVEDILEIFSIDVKRQGAQDFVEFVVLIAAERLKNPQKLCASDVLFDMARRRGIWYKALNSRMKWAIRPMIEADPQALLQLGIKAKKTTVAYFAYALEGRLRNASLQNQDC